MRESALWMRHGSEFRAGTCLVCYRTATTGRQRKLEFEARLRDNRIRPVLGECVAESGCGPRSKA